MTPDEFKAEVYERAFRMADRLAPFMIVGAAIVGVLGFFFGPDMPKMQGFPSFLFIISCL